MAKLYYNGMTGRPLTGEEEERAINYIRDRRNRNRMYGMWSWTFIHRHIADIGMDIGMSTIRALARENGID